MARNRDFQYSIKPSTARKDLKSEFIKLQHFLRRRQPNPEQLLKIIQDTAQVRRKWANGIPDKRDERLEHFKRDFLSSAFRLVGAQIGGQMDNFTSDQFLDLMVAQNSLGIVVNTKASISSQYLKRVNTLLKDDLNANTLIKLLNVLDIFKNQLDLSKLKLDSLKPSIANLSKNDFFRVLSHIDKNISKAELKDIYGFILKEHLKKPGFIESCGAGDIINLINSANKLGITLSADACQRIESRALGFTVDAVMCVKAAVNRFGDRQSDDMRKLASNLARTETIMRISEFNAEELCNAIDSLTTSNNRLTNQICTAIKNRVIGNFEPADMIKVHQKLHQHADRIDDNTLIPAINTAFTSQRSLMQVFAPMPPSRTPNLRHLMHQATTEALSAGNSFNSPPLNMHMTICFEVMKDGQRYLVQRDTHMTRGEGNSWVTRYTQQRLFQQQQGTYQAIPH